MVTNSVKSPKDEQNLKTEVTTTLYVRHGLLIAPSEGVASEDTTCGVKPTKPRWRRRLEKKPLACVSATKEYDFVGKAALG
jgi:hypothetical protein